MKELSIIIVNFNTKQILKDCLESVYKHLTDIDFEIIVVDNNSQDESVLMIKKEFTEINIIANNRNIGFGPANNQGIEVAQGKYILFLNNDTYIFDNSIQKMIKYLAENSEYGVVGPQLLNKDRSIQLSASQIFPSLYTELLRNFLLDRIILNRLFQDRDYFGRYQLSPNQHKKSREVSFVSGACFLVKRKVIEKTKGFDKRFFFYQEEIDWMKRIHEAGWKIYFLSDAKIVHLGGVATESSMKNTKRFDYQIVSRYKYFVIHYGVMYSVGIRIIDIIGSIFFFNYIDYWMAVNAFE
ncbi:glycosyltransferase family 2 protein [Patescibacteria group bacterium]